MSPVTNEQWRKMEEYCNKQLPADYPSEEFAANPITDQRIRDMVKLLDQQKAPPNHYRPPTAYWLDRPSREPPQPNTVEQFGHTFQVPPGVMVSTHTDLLGDHLSLQVRHWVTNALDTQKWTEVMCNQSMRCTGVDGVDAVCFGDLLREALRILVTHELDEWLACDGKHIVQPH